MISHFPARQEHPLVVPYELLGGIGHCKEQCPSHDAVAGIIDRDGPGVIDLQGIFLWEEKQDGLIEVTHSSVTTLDTQKFTHLQQDGTSELDRHRL